MIDQMYKSKKLKDLVTRIEKSPTWGEILKAMHIDDTIVIDHSDANYVRSEISSNLRLNCPDMQFSTKKQTEEGKDYLLIKREL
ncbi:hypothetical protein MASR2M52_01780 [Pedobacter sp.]